MNWITLESIFDWIDIFDYTFFSCELKLLKPEPEIYKHALEQTGIAANQILFYR